MATPLKILFVGGASRCSANWSIMLGAPDPGAMPDPGGAPDLGAASLIGVGSPIARCGFSQGSGLQPVTLLFPSFLSFR